MTKFSLKYAAEIIVLGLLSGTASFLFMPLIAAGGITKFFASVMGVIIAFPLIWYFLRVPEGSIDTEEYLDARGAIGVMLDIIMVFLAGMAPSIIILYFVISLNLLPPVPEAVSAAIGVFIGYSAFLYRNRKFFDDGSIEVKL